MSEKTSSLVDQLLSPKTRYEVNQGPVAEKRSIGVGYKDKGAQTAEHEKIIDISDSRSNLRRSILIPRISRAFNDNITLTSVGKYSERLKVKLKLFNRKDEEYEQQSARIKQERANSRRKLTSTEAKSERDRRENWKIFYENHKITRGNNPFRSRENQEEKEYSATRILFDKEGQGSFEARFSEIGRIEQTRQLSKPSSASQGKNVVGEILFHTPETKRWEDIAYSCFWDLD